MSHKGKWIYYFSDDDIFADADESLRTLGGKGRSLKEMTKAGLAVPPGFTISTECCLEYLKNGGRWPEGLHDELRVNMERLEKYAGRKYGSGPEPLLVSVRSGAPVSMPGMMDTILNCGLDVDDPWKALEGAVNEVFDSWNSDRAVSYRERNGLTDNTGTAVNIQMMFPSSVSGVVFTRSPSDPEGDIMIVEASYGLGEAVVSGDADPDRFTLSRSGFDVLETYIGRKNLSASQEGSAESSMTPELLAELGGLSLKVEEYFGYPLDIEFGYDGTKLALLQSRRIRGMDLVMETARSRDSECAELGKLAADKRRVWISHNLSETLAHPTPLTWDVVRYLMSGAGGMGEMYRRLGYAVPDDGESEFLQLICGNVYADPARIVEMLWRGLPVSCDLDALESDIERLENPPVVLDPDKADPLLLFRLPQVIWNSISSGRKIKNLKKTAQADFENLLLPEFLDYVEKERLVDLERLSDSDLIDLLSERRHVVLRDFAAATLVPGFLGALSMGALTAMLQRLLGKNEGRVTAQVLTGSLNSISAGQYSMLQLVAAGEVDLDEFLEKFGHRTAGEMELSVPRWREDHGVLDSMLRDISTAGSADSNDSKCESLLQDAELKLPSQLSDQGASSFHDRVCMLLEETRRLLPYRENGKHYLMMGYELIRSAIVEVGRRRGLGEDVFYLHWNELMAGAQVEIKDLAERKLRHKALKSLYVPPLVDSDDLDSIGRGPELDSERKISATPVSPGVASARARILFEPRGFTSTQEDFILVCPSTDPGWTPLLTKASGLIVERGGILSHGALIARDLGVPAVVLPDATRLIGDGSMVIIDGTSGAVEISEEADKE